MHSACSSYFPLYHTYWDKISLSCSSIQLLLHPSSPVTGRIPETVYPLPTRHFENIIDQFSNLICTGYTTNAVLFKVFSVLSLNNCIYPKKDLAFPLSSLFQFITFPPPQLPHVAYSCIPLRSMELSWRDRAFYKTFFLSADKTWNYFFPALLAHAKFLPRPVGTLKVQVPLTFAFSSKLLILCLWNHSLLLLFRCLVRDIKKIWHTLQLFDQLKSKCRRKKEK